jgi:hypothetical protein
MRSQEPDYLLVKEVLCIDSRIRALLLPQAILGCFPGVGCPAVDVRVSGYVDTLPVLEEKGRIKAVRPDVIVKSKMAIPDVLLETLGVGVSGVLGSRVRLGRSSTCFSFG